MRLGPWPADGMIADCVSPRIPSRASGVAGEASPVSTLVLEAVDDLVETRTVSLVVLLSWTGKDLATTGLCFSMAATAEGKQLLQWAAMWAGTGLVVYGITMG